MSKVDVLYACIAACNFLAQLQPVADWSLGG